MLEGIDSIEDIYSTVLEDILYIMTLLESTDIFEEIYLILPRRYILYTALLEGIDSIEDIYNTALEDISCIMSFIRRY